MTASVRVAGKLSLVLSQPLFCCLFTSSWLFFALKRIRLATKGEKIMHIPKEPYILI